MQKVFIAGTVASVRELKDVGQNKVFNFSVAVSNGKNQDGSWKDSSFYDVGVWGNRGESLARFLTKGTKVAVSGRLQPPRVHEGKAYLSLDSDEVTLLGGGDQQAQQQAPQQQQSGYGAGGLPDEIPFAPCIL